MKQNLKTFTKVDILMMEKIPVNEVILLQKSQRKVKYFFGAFIYHRKEVLSMAIKLNG